jgi:GNAT superfamily N-acetyltransferase
MLPLTVGDATIRPADASDCERIFELIRELAEYERLLHCVEGSPEILREALFVANPHVFCLVLELEGQLIGYALYFLSFSSFLTRHGIWLEDIYVQPEYRGKGYVKAMLHTLARIGVEKAYGRVEWAVLDWNQPSIDFYEALGAVRMLDWQICRLSGQSLVSFAG